MNLSFTVTQSELSDLLLNLSPVRPVFIWGAPGIGKSALVTRRCRPRCLHSCRSPADC